jgi:hypothetical protein
MRVYAIDCHHNIYERGAVQMSALSSSYFVFGDDYHSRKRETTTTLLACNSSSDSVWEYISCQLNDLCLSVWGTDLKNCISQGRSQADCFSLDTANTRIVVFLPSFDIFVPRMIDFVCSLQSKTDGVNRFCHYVSSILFDCFAQGLCYSSPNSEND